MNELSQAQAGAPASASPDTLVKPEQPTENKPLTIADVERIAEEKATRIAQSMVDKAENRISKRAQEQIAAIDLSKSTLGLSDEQVQQAKQRVIFDDLTAKPTAEPASFAPQTQTTPAPDVDPALAELYEIFQAEGVQIADPNSPQGKEIQAVLADPNGNMHALRKVAYKAVAEIKQAQASMKETAAARVLSGGQPNQSGGANPDATAHDLWDGAYKK